MTADQQLTPAGQIEQAWALYRTASGGLNDAYDAAIQAALSDLGKVTAEGYAAFDQAAAVAWEALMAGTAEARHFRDRAVDDAIGRLDPATAAELRGQEFAG